MGWLSPIYAVVYALGSLFMLGAALLVVMEAKPNGIEWRVALFFGGALGWLTYYGLNGVGDVNIWIVLPQGTALCILGAALGFKAPFTKERSILVPLSVLWLLLGAFDFGLLLHPTSEIWAKLADMGSYFLVIAAFAWIGVRSRYGTHRKTLAANTA